MLTRKEELMLEKDCAEGKISALQHIGNRIEGEMENLVSKINKSQGVALLSTAVSAVSAYLLASTDDFNTMVAHNGIDVLTTPEGMVMAGITAAGFAVAGGSLLYEHFKSKELAKKEDDLVDVKYKEYQCEKELQGINFEQNLYRINSYYDELGAQPTVEAAPQASVEVTPEG